MSQFLIRNVLYDRARPLEDLFFRCLLFKFFNKIETWELLERYVGEITVSSFDERLYDAILSKALARGERIYSAAYIMPSGGVRSVYRHKHQMHLKLLRGMLDDNLWEKVAEADSMARVFTLLRSYPTIGDFLAYQYAIDINYSPLTNFTEMEFVVPGPGAREGIRKCFEDPGQLTEAEIIRAVAGAQNEHFQRLGLKFQDLWGRPLQLIDCQNLFCEVAKYARVAHPEFNPTSGRVRIKQKFRPSLVPLVLWYPPKWRINDRLQSHFKHVSSS